MHNAIENFHKTKLGQFSHFVAATVLAYASISKAIDTGSMIWYGLALLFLVLALKNLLKFVQGVLRKGPKLRA